MDKEIFSNRTAVYEAARQKNPNRWSKKIRNWSLEDEVWLNPEKDEENATNKSIG
jgi:putative transposase